MRNLSAVGTVEIKYLKSSENFFFVSFLLFMVDGQMLMMVAKFFLWWSGSLRGSHSPLSNGRMTCLRVKSWWHSPIWLRDYHQCSLDSEKRIGWTLLSQLSLAFKPGLTEGNVDFVCASSEAKSAVYLWGLSVSFRSISARTFHAAMLRGFFFFCFLFSTVFGRGPRPWWSKAGNIWGTFSSPFPMLRGWAVLYSHTKTAAEHYFCSG